MSPSDLSPVSAEPPRSRLRMPRWGWHLLSLATVICFALHVHFEPNDARVQHLIESKGARVDRDSRGVSVRFASAKVGDDDLDGINQVRGIYNLTAAGPGVTDVGVQHLSVLADLRHLDLSKTKTTDAGLIHLRMLSKLEELSLADTQVTDAGLIHVKELVGLKTLSLDGTHVTDDGVKYLRALTRLEGLTLRQTAITEEGVAELRRALPGLVIWR